MKDVLRNKNASVVLISLLEGEMKISQLQESAIKNYSTEFRFFNPKLREFVKKWINDNGYKLAKRYEKYVEKYW